MYSRTPVVPVDIGKWSICRDDRHGRAYCISRTVRGSHCGRWRDRVWRCPGRARKGQDVAMRFSFAELWKSCEWWLNTESVLTIAICWLLLVFGRIQTRVDDSVAKFVSAPLELKWSSQKEGLGFCQDSILLNCTAGENSGCIPISVQYWDNDNSINQSG